MSNPIIDYINPYSSVSQLFTNGLDYIAANCISSSSSSAPLPTVPTSDCDCLDDTEVQNLIDCIYTFLDNNYDVIDGDPINKQAVKATLANAVNGYLESGGRDRALVQSLQAVPVPSIGGYFDRMFQNTGASANIKNHKSSQQLSLEIGKASFEYWNNEVTKGAAPGAWGQYLTGNEALDTTYIPYWISAAMCGSRFNFFQDNATDSLSVTLTTMLGLGGALVVNAGKVMFGWVAEITKPSAAQLGPVQHGVTKRVWGYSCYTDQGDWVTTGGVSEDTQEQAEQAVHVIQSLYGSGVNCSLDVV